MKAYYACPRALQSSAQSYRDLALLSQRRGWKVVNPNSRKYEGFEFDDYVKLCASCDLLVFRPFPDGKIGSGNGLEIKQMRQARKEVFEIVGTKLKRRTLPDLKGRILTRDETRDRSGLPPLAESYPVFAQIMEKHGLGESPWGPDGGWGSS